jgi:hypothetical protein
MGGCSMLDGLKRFWRRSRVAWGVLRGREWALHAAIHDGRPIGRGLTIFGSVVAPENAVLLNTMVRHDGHQYRDGIVTGPNSVISYCVVTGVGRSGYAVATPRC